METLLKSTMLIVTYLSSKKSLLKKFLKLFHNKIVSLDWQQPLINFNLFYSKNLYTQLLLCCKALLKFIQNSSIYFLLSIFHGYHLGSPERRTKSMTFLDTIDILVLSPEMFQITLIPLTSTQ